ncbi:hypothetical protein M407DRAFT_84541 [Tulasnella calospora MUT 4182]|uniref:EamA domain-containing protein n=1 Tax=Tulasnella calospora MUT 4182 TaxID=1051891 RepID=A0A0C3Q4Q3_9AGAM|nr:hypothetical protein M407DRAFT_84541 [Tulasnella calospora MUT 4182]
MANDAYIPFLIAGMLITGCSNSLWTKWQDMQCVENCGPLDDPTTRVYFEQPVWQTLQMFVGEVGCFLPVLYTYLKNKRNPAPMLADDEPDHVDHAKGLELKGWKVLLFFLPAACDLTGTTLMNVGLLYTPVSIYQMTRGALVLWVGIFSVIFLRRRLFLYQWLSLITVMIGVSIVGLSGSLIKKSVTEDSSIPDAFRRALSPSTAASDPTDAARVLIGVLFILFAQLFTAAQFVIEEKVMAKYSVTPLVAVGLEGTFGLISILAVMPLLYTMKDLTVWFDLPRGWRQMVDNRNVLVSSFIIAMSIGFFNFFGLSVTRSVSATARSTIDTCRTLGIWIVSLGLGWEVLQFPFSALQVTGFGLLVYGTFVFNNIVLPPTFVRPGHHHGGVDENSPLLDEEEEGRALLAGRHLDETAVLPSDEGRTGFDVVPPPTRGAN